MKILNLVYNEVLKQVKKRSFKVCLVILLLFSIGMPILYKTFAYSENSFPLYSDIDVTILEENLIENPSTDQQILENKLTQEEIDVAKMAINKNESNSSFKSEIYSQYLQAKRMLTIIETLKNNEEIDYEFIDENFYLDSTFYTDLSLEELEKLEEEYISTEQEFKSVIDSGNYTWYLKMQIETLEKDEERDATTENILNVYKKLFALNITNENDFRISEAENIIRFQDTKEEITSRQDYDKMGSSLSYDNYLKLTKEKNRLTEEDIQKSWYSIENNINYNKEGAKTALSDSIQNNIAVLSIIAVIIAGGIVSSEFQKGTIRFLVIRPNKRWKILLSKFLSVLVIVLGLAIISYIISFVMNGILFGFGDFSIPNLIVESGKVIETSYIFGSIKSLLLLLVPLVFIAVIAFSLSTITNNTAISVGFSIFTLMGSSLVVMLLVLFGFPFISYTFLPYMDFGQFLDKSTLIDNCLFYETYYTLGKAFLVLLIWGTILYFISNIVFVRKDIKN